MFALTPCQQTVRHLSARLKDRETRNAKLENQIAKLAEQVSTVENRALQAGEKERELLMRQNAASDEIDRF
jgi:septal ring factor EnvC (AmiA/AmiB activator)